MWRIEKWKGASVAHVVIVLLVAVAGPVVAILGYVGRLERNK